MYAPGNQFDKRALQALLKFNTLAGGRSQPESLGGLSQEEFDHAVECGLLFRPNKVTYTHAEASERLLSAVSAVDKKVHVAMFLASLSTGRRDFRVGLPAYAIAHTFSEHDFTPMPTGVYCVICGMTPDGNYVYRSNANRERFSVGGVLGTAPPDIGFYLECQQLLEPAHPTTEDLAILGAILTLLAEAAPDDTAKQHIAKQTRKLLGPKASAEEARCLLETLGYCGILETPTHGGMLHRYINLGTAPSKTHSSDWRYPADFWTGKDGINGEAMRFWFGEYEELAPFMQGDVPLLK